VAPSVAGSLRLHDLRHTFCSILVVLSEDPGVVAEQLGHSDPAFTMKYYRHAMRRDEQSKAELRALVQGIVAVDSASNGTNEGQTVPVENNGHGAHLAY
jgi:Phage integrase family